MEYKKIESVIYNNNLIKRENYKSKKEYDLYLDMMLIENLKKCIDKKIPIEMNEKDFSKVYKVYLKLLKNHYNIDSSFINNLISILPKKLDFFEIIESITE